MLDLAIVDKLNRAGFVVAPYNTPEEVRRCSTRPDLAELLPFDEDAGSSSNMVSSQPGRPLGLQSWAERSTFSTFAAHRIFRWKKPRTSEYKIWYVSVWLFPEKGKESPLPPGTPLSRTDFLRKGFLRDCRGRAYQPLQRDEPAQTRF